MIACVVGWAPRPFGKHEKEAAESLIAQGASRRLPMPVCELPSSLWAVRAVANYVSILEPLR